ncbi:MOSC-domain-containing protein [Corynespora cassiicola Philippines]|uniref:MOSC-domain-containing protein n=1 Tax=Corynespora cassiicola Philippines TaxID=1448308 RepID=A0A2T2P7N8_CORCC|nr:MOSC-domain-containing protein [Corynespora cassiicola Philippines]
MAISSATQAAIVLTVFLLPILTYLYLTGSFQTTSKPTEPLPPPTEITNLYIYPIKSCHGISVRSAKLLPTGLDLDRQWMWIAHPSNTFLTIRQNARMTLIRPSYTASTDTLTITAPAPNSIDAKLEFSIPAHPSPAWLAENASRERVKIWNTWTPAHVFSADLTEGFDAFFGQEVRLVYKSPEEVEEPRALKSNGAKEILGREGRTCFPDMMPVLVGCESSIEELNERVGKVEGGEGPRIDVRRFRPNVLVKGHEAWSEDRWKTVSILPPSTRAGSIKGGGGKITLDVTQRCARCHVPNVDPETAEEHKRQPWDTLMKYRRVDEGIKFKPCFGMLCVPREGGEVKVGMKMSVDEVTDDHRYIAGF